MVNDVLLEYMAQNCFISDLFQFSDTTTVARIQLTQLRQVPLYRMRVLIMVTTMEKICIVPGTYGLPWENMWSLRLKRLKLEELACKSNYSQTVE